MFLTSYIFKSKAVRALKGNWQTALIVSFLAGLPATVNMLLRSTQLPAVYPGISVEELLGAVEQIGPGTYWLLGVAGLISLLLMPVLSVSCNYYFIKRVQGEDLGVMGVLSRRKYFVRALILHLYMYVRILGWSLLFIVPGVLAALRYAMAPYYLAENPELTPTQAINKSKEVMADKKLGYLLLLLSFVGWALMAYVTQIMLLSISLIIAQVAYQFIELFLITYLNASVAAFFLAASRAGGIDSAKKEADSFMRQIGARVPGDAGNRDREHKPDGEEKTDGEDQE
ncbi:MAG: DUF975 family protein [Firmicutes bacterium]|nr:DUF975 family protein [Bacillota bacterium]